MDRTLVERAIQGDEDAYAGLMAIAGDRLLAIAYRILRDLHDAEDAVQMALVNAWRDLPTLRDADRFEAWLTRLLVRACYAEADRGRRSNANIRVLPIDLRGTSDPDVHGHRPGSPGSGLSAPSNRPARDRRAPSLRGGSQPEIAHALEIPIGTVKSRLFYATRALRAAIEADDRPTSAERRA